MPVKYGCWNGANLSDKDKENVPPRERMGRVKRVDKVGDKSNKDQGQVQICQGKRGQTKHPQDSPQIWLWSQIDMALLSLRTRLSKWLLRRSKLRTSDDWCKLIGYSHSVARRARMPSHSFLWAQRRRIFRDRGGLRPVKGRWPTQSVSSASRRWSRKPGSCTASMVTSSAAAATTGCPRPRRLAPTVVSDDNNDICLEEDYVVSDLSCYACGHVAKHRQELVQHVRTHSVKLSFQVSDSER